MTGEVLIQVTAPHFCAGVVLQDNRVTRTAPILSYMRGWPTTRLWCYCYRKGWRCDEVALDNSPAKE